MKRELAALAAWISKAKSRELARVVPVLLSLVEQARARIGGRPRTVVDYVRVQELAKLGMREMSSIARVMGHKPDLFRDQTHRAAVQEAMACGRAEWEAEALQQYEDGIRNKGGLGQKMPLLIFKLKQCGWSDRIAANTGAPTVDLSGARERLMALVAKFRASQPPPTCSKCGGVAA